MPQRTEAGAAGVGAIVLALAGALAFTLSLGAARAGAAAAARARADGAADLVALAAVVDPASGAARTARANDATVERTDVAADGVVHVVIRRQGVEAEAAAAAGEDRGRTGARR